MGNDINKPGRGFRRPSARRSTWSLIILSLGVVLIAVVAWKFWPDWNIADSNVPPAESTQPPATAAPER